jgi:hypothetical protein
MNFRKKRLVITLLIAAILMLTLTYLFPRPVLLRLKDPSAVDPGDGLLVIFNPFRNRAPERYAEQFLERLKEGKCLELKAIAEQNYEYICTKESEHKLLNWKLVDIKKESRKLILFYRALRVGYKGYDGNTWLNVEQQGDGWEVTSFEAWY